MADVNSPFIVVPRLSGPVLTKKSGVTPLSRGRVQLMNYTNRSPIWAMSAGLAEAPVDMGQRGQQVIEGHDYHQRQQKGHAHEVDQRLSLRPDASPPNGFDHHEQRAPAVEGGQGQHVDDGEAGAEATGDQQDREPPARFDHGVRRLSGDLRHPREADRPRHLGRELAGQHHNWRRERYEDEVEGAPQAEADRLNRVVRHGNRSAHELNAQRALALRGLDTWTDDDSYRL